MALHFHTLTVQKIEAETASAVSVTLAVPPGLQKEFSFKQGQNVTVRKKIDGEYVRRSYSICSSPLDNELKVGIKQAFNGRFSNYVHTQLKAGDCLEVMPPTGNFYTELDPSHKKTYAAFAAGSGITPILSIIKTTLAIELHSKFILVFGNSNHQSIMFKEDLEALKDKYMVRFSIHYLLSREITETDIYHGRINEQKCLQLKRIINFQAADEFFICGPVDMTFSVKNFLKNEGIDGKRVHFELFNPPGKPNPGVEPTFQKPIADLCDVTVKLDGRSFKIALDYNSNTILDAALAEGADLPFACKGGVCTTCRAKLVEGEIEMEVNYGLEDDEVKAGFILTCQSRPRSKKVVVDYDIT